MGGSVRFTGVVEQKDMGKMTNNTCNPHRADW